MIFIRSASDQMTYCRLELGLLAADLLSAAVEDAAQVQVVALLCRLEGHPESARRGLVDAGENQKLLALRVQIVHRQGTRWPTARWADRGGARRGGQAPATRPGYTTASGENRWRGRRRGRLLRRHVGLGCRGQDWCDGRGAHIAIPGGWTRAPLFGGGVPMSISPKDALKSVVTRTMDSFVSFPRP